MLKYAKNLLALNIYLFCFQNGYVKHTFGGFFVKINIYGGKWKLRSKVMKYRYKNNLDDIVILKLSCVHWNSNETFIKKSA